MKVFPTAVVITAPSPATSGTSLVVDTGHGARLDEGFATLHPEGVLPTHDTAEIVEITGISTDTVTMVRAQKTTTAKAVDIGWRITNGIYKDDFNAPVTNEVPGGTINGTNDDFTTAVDYVPGTLKVFKNGVRMKGSGADFTETSGGFTMVTPPATGTVLLVDYYTTGTAYVEGYAYTIYGETPSGSVNGTNVDFVTASSYIGGTLQVYVNGLLQATTTHVTEDTPSAGEFSLDTAPQTGDIVRVNYQHAHTATGNSDTVDGIHANTTATANQLFPLDANAKHNPAVMPLGFAHMYIQDQDGNTVTNTEHTGLAIIAGWGQIIGNGAASAQETITLPVTFSQILYVGGTPLGTTGTDSTPAADITDFEVTPSTGAMVTVDDITTSGFTMSYAVPATLTTTRYWGYSWIAIGVL